VGTGPASAVVVLAAQQFVLCRMQVGKRAAGAILFTAAAQRPAVVVGLLRGARVPSERAVLEALRRKETNPMEAALRAGATESRPLLPAVLAEAASSLTDTGGDFSLMLACAGVAALLEVPGVVQAARGIKVKGDELFEGAGAEARGRGGMVTRRRAKERPPAWQELSLPVAAGQAMARALIDSSEVGEREGEAGWAAGRDGAGGSGGEDGFDGWGDAGGQWEDGGVDGDADLDHLRGDEDDEGGEGGAGGTDGVIYEDDAGVGGGMGMGMGLGAGGPFAPMPETDDELAAL